MDASARLVMNKFCWQITMAYADGLKWHSKTINKAYVYLSRYI